MPLFSNQVISKYFLFYGVLRSFRAYPRFYINGLTLLNLSVVKGARAVRSAECTKKGRAVKFPARPQSFVFLLEVYLSLGGLGGGDEAALVVGAQHLALAVERVVEVVAVEDYEARVVALGDAVAREVQCVRGV